MPGKNMLTSEHYLVAIVFPLTSLAGIAALLRSGEDITYRAVTSVVLNSGLFGVCVASLMVHKVGVDSWALIIGISVLAGLGGNAAIDLAITVAKKAIQERVK